MPFPVFSHNFVSFQWFIYTCLCLPSFSLFTSFRDEFTFLSCAITGGISGSDAMFADLCYFSVRSVQVRISAIDAYFCLISGFLWYLHFCFSDFFYCINYLMQLTFVFLVFPCLLLGYLGQAAFLMENLSQNEQVFFSSIPSKLELPINFIVIS